MSQNHTFFIYVYILFFENKKFQNKCTSACHILLNFSKMKKIFFFFDLLTFPISPLSFVCVYTYVCEGNWYRVKCRTAVRRGVILDSDQVALINSGILVHVVEKFGRRVQIDNPYRGFCSLHDGAGLDILTPLPVSFGDKKNI